MTERMTGEDFSFTYKLQLEVRCVGKLCGVTDNKMLKIFTGAIYRYK